MRYTLFRCHRHLKILYFMSVALGSRVALWTVNDPEVASKWLEAGVDGIITDQPDKILLLIE